jgi:hypothetical protein
MKNLIKVCWICIWFLLFIIFTFLLKDLTFAFLPLNTLESFLATKTDVHLSRRRKKLTAFKSLLTKKAKIFAFTNREAKAVSQVN